MARGPIVVNPWHWLGPDGSFLDDAKIRRRAIRVAQCIEYGGPLADGECRETLISCRFRPGRTPCPGLLWVLKQQDEAILAFCAVCHGEEFLIYEWEDTPWAHGPMVPVHVADLARDAGEQRVEPREAAADHAPELLVRALEVLGSSMRASDVVAHIAVAPHPMAVLQAVVDGLPRPPTKGAIERFLPVLTEIWNTTPRPELAGKSPAHVRREAADSDRVSETKVGRNAPCPCGSGKKYKRCCWQNASLH